MGATLQLLAVMPGQAGDLADLDGSAAEAGVVPLWMHAERDAHMRHMASYLDFKKEELHAAGAPVKVEVAYGQPAAEIADTGQRQPASLVVIATHARSGFQRLWLGSVAQQALEHAVAPMLLVRAGDEHSSNLRHVMSHEEAFVAGL